MAEFGTGQTALVKRKARQRALFDSARDLGMIVTDPAGAITDWDPGAIHVFGSFADEMRGRSAERFFTPEDVARGLTRGRIVRSMLLQSARS